MTELPTAPAHYRSAGSQLLLVVWLGLLVAGCETAPLMTEQDPDADFSHYRTFTLMPLGEPSEANDPARARLLVQAAREAAVASLASKGYAEAPTNEADLAVKLQGQSLPRDEGASRAFANSVRTARGTVKVFNAGSADSLAYEDRSLQVEVFDNHTHGLVWSGSIWKISAAPPQPEEVRKAVHRILARFPSRATPVSYPP